jgi:hypothetical protein
MFEFIFKRKYKKYMDMKKIGKTPREIYLAAKADGLELLICFEMLNYVCGLSTDKAYEVIFDYEKYLAMKKSGKSPREVYLAAKADGIDVDTIQFHSVLGGIFGLSMEKAKEVAICDETGARSLSEYQEKHVLPALKEAFEQEERKSTKNKDTPPKQ